MRAGSLLSRVQRVEGVLTPRGQLVVVKIHDCQQQTDLEAQARRVLGREWRRGDVCIVIMSEDDCDPDPHQHHDEVIVHHRLD